MSNTSDLALINSTDHEYYDYELEWEGLIYSSAMTIISIFILSLVVFFGGFANFAAAVILIRSRLWVKDERYIHVLAILVGNIVILTVVYFPHWLSLFRHSYHVGVTTEFMCKIWRFLAQAVFGTGWYVVALLLGVYLRGQLSTQGGRRGCCQKFAVKYCSLFASKIVVAVISGSFALMNLWQLWIVRLIDVGSGKNAEKLCEIGYEWYHVFAVWEFVSMCFMWYLPVVILLPVVWAMTLYTQRRQRTGFSFVPLNNYEIFGKDLSRASLFIGAGVFLLEFPIVALHVWSEIGLGYFSHSLIIAYGVAHLISTLHLVLVPVLCLTGLGKMREVVKSALCCRSFSEGICNRYREDSMSGPLSLEAIENEALESARGTLENEP